MKKSLLLLSTLSLLGVNINAAEGGLPYEDADILEEPLPPEAPEPSELTTDMQKWLADMANRDSLIGENHARRVALKLKARIAGKNLTPTQKEQMQKVMTLVNSYITRNKSKRK